MGSKESMLLRNALIMAIFLTVCLAVSASGQTVEEAGPRAEDAETPQPQESYSDAIVVTPKTAPAEESLLRAIARPSDTVHSPEASVAETLQRLPGVVVSRDRGRADGILVRGAQARLVATTLDGERLPSPEGASRSAGVGMVPLELLESATVAKIYSPDRDADAIGATIDLVTRSLPAAGVRRLTIGGGVEEPGGTGTVADVSYGRRLARDSLGALVTLSTKDSESHPDRVEHRFGDGEVPGVERLDLRDFTLSDRRDAALVRLDWQPGTRSELQLRGFWNGFSTDELRRRAKIDFEEGEIERELKNGRLERQMFSLRAAGNYLIDGTLEIDYAAFFSDSRQDEPFRVDTAFVAEELEDLTAGGVASLDPSVFLLSEIGTEDNALRDATSAFSFNLQTPVKYFERPVHLKAGAKIRHKDRRQDQNTVLFEPESEFRLSDFLDPAFPGSGFARGGFLLGPVPDPDIDVFSSGFDLTGQRSFEEDAADYSATERTVAAYLLTDWEWSPRTEFSAGFRYERTDTEYSGNEVLAGENEAESSLRPLLGGSSYDFVMPSLSLVFELREGLLLRTAISRTFARPDYVDLIPFELIDLEDEEIETGNPALDVTSSWNFDAALEWRFGSGSVSIAGFYKSMKDFTFRSRSEAFRGEDLFEVSQPRSGEAADLLGLELALENDFDKWLPGLSAELHVTVTDSNARFGALSQQSLRLPGQAAYSGNLLLGYRYGRFSTAVALSVVDDYLFELGESREDDLYTRKEFRLDLSGNFNLGRSCHLFLQAKNLGDEVSTLFQGNSDRIYRQDFSGRSFVVGLRYDF